MLKFSAYLISKIASLQQKMSDRSDALKINPFLSSKPAKKELKLVAEPQKIEKRIISGGFEEECYSNQNESRGICVILEHDIFAPNLQLR